ncbi:LysR substrate-binding domain-containing protein [Arthrobacter roseus]|uniref:LysR substrate-binding domain-containing protein n=1 Tax=Arthrobacter roseus TaxID=136274 RepID=UPI0019634EAF
MLDDRTLGYIVAVARTGSLRGAAKLLGVAPSAVQRALAGAERRVGCLLFERGTTGARSTAAGRLVIQHAQERCDLDAQFSVQLSLVTSAAVGEVTIGVGPGFIDQFASRVLSPFMHDHPNVQVDIITGGTSELVARLQRDEVDVTVALHPTVDRGVRVVNSVPQPVGLACAVDHRLAAESLIRPAQLSHERMAVLPEGFGLRALHDGFVRAHGVETTVAVQSDSQRAIVAAVATGRVVALLPPVTVTRAVATGAVVLIPVDDAYLARVSAALLTRTGRRLTPAAAALLEACSGWFED